MPWDLARDTAGHFYVLAGQTETPAYNVYRFDPQWNFVTGFPTGIAGNADPSQTRPHFCLDEIGNIYITDPLGCQVKAFAPSDVRGPTVSYNSYAAEPVNTYTGRYVYSHTDFEVGDIGYPFRFTRTYNSGDEYFDIFGPGWSHSYDIRVSEPRAKALLLRWGDGREVVYEYYGPDEDPVWHYDPVLPGTYDDLAREADGTYALTRKDGIVYAFGTNGRLMTVTDKNENVTSLAYDVSNRLVAVTCPSDRVYQLNYHPSGLLANIEDPLARQVSYGYAANGQLGEAADAEGNGTQFAYDEYGWMTEIVDAVGNTVFENTYIYPEGTTPDPDTGKVASQANAKGDVTTFEYQPNQTTMTDPLGTRTVYGYDELGRLIQQVDDPDDLNFVTQYEYDEDNNRTLVRDPLGNTTQYAYDTDGNMTQKTDALGNTVAITYDDANLPMSKKDEADNVTQFEYDANGNLTKTIDPLGNEWLRTYDAQGLLLSEEDPLGNVTQHAYDSEGNRTSTTDANENVTTSTHDAVGRLLSETDALDNTTTYEYDGNDMLLAKTDALGQVTSYEYDANGNRVRIIYPDGSQETFTYNETDFLATEADELGRVTTHAYDANGKKTSVTDADGGVTSYAYDAVSNMVSSTDANGNATEYTYDGNGNRLSATDPLGSATTMAYDELNRNTSATDALGNTTTMTYDAMGRVLSRTAPDGGVTAFSYDALGRKTSGTDPLGNVTLFRYDDAGRLVETENALGQITVYTYDANGNRKQAQDPLGHRTTFAYDALNRQISTTDALGNTTETQYDALGRDVGVADALGRATVYGYDARDRLVGVADALGNETAYGYDDAGNMTNFTNARGKTWTYDYDELNRRTSETTPLGHTDEYVYDSVGNRTEHTGPDDQITTYDYDEANRLTDVHYPDGLDVHYEYDAAGRRTSMTDGVGATLYECDAVGQILETTDPFGKTVGYTYDLAGNRTGITYPGGDEVHYTYDALNRMQTVTDWAGNTTTYQYDDAGRLQQEIAPNGIVTAYQYDVASRLIHKTIAKPDKTVVAEYDITLDDVGNRTNIDVNQPQMPPSPDFEVTDSDYDDENRILTAGETTYQFDARGRMTSKSAPTGTTTYTFDYRDRLTQVAATERTDLYRYDGDGNRIESTYAADTTRYVLDLTRDMTWVLCETDSGGVMTAKYVYGLGLISADVDGAAHFLHYDQLGSTVALTDAAGNVTDACAFDEFGDIIAAFGSTASPFQYVGQYGVMHEDNGLLFMRARYYDQTVGRFLTKDPVCGPQSEPLSLTLYLYGLDNPVVRRDPTGEFVITGSFLVICGAVWLASGAFAADYALSNPAPEGGGVGDLATYVAGGAISSAAKGLSFITPVGGAFTTAAHLFDKAEKATGDPRAGAAREIADLAGLLYGFADLYGIGFKGHAHRPLMQYSTRTGQYISDAALKAHFAKNILSTLGKRGAGLLGQYLTLQR